MQIFIYMEPWQPGGMPEMVFEYILKQKGLDRPQIFPSTRTSTLAPRPLLFPAEPGDFTVEFEPGATSLEKEGKGYVVDSLGVESGYVPYTAYCARGSYLKENEKTVQNFVNALKKGMEYVSSHTPEDIAKTIQPQFKETDLDVITRIVRRYAEQDTWKTDLNFEKESFELLQDILTDAGELKERVPYEKLVTVKYTENRK